MGKTSFCLLSVLRAKYLRSPSPDPRHGPGEEGEESGSADVGLRGGKREEGEEDAGEEGLVAGGRRREEQTAVQRYQLCRERRDGRQVAKPLEQ